MEESLRKRLLRYARNDEGARSDLFVIPVNTGIQRFVSGFPLSRE